MIARERVAEPFRQWVRREWLLALITFGIGIDSLPFLLTEYLPQLVPLSGTRFIVIPGLALAFLRRPSWLIRPHALGLAYLVAVLVGGGLGWMAGTVPAGRLTTLAVNGLILLYYMDVRSLDSLRHVLVITFVLSLTVPIVQDLTAVGIIPEAWLLSLGGIRGGGGRVFSIFDTTTPGFIPLVIPACLGGLIFLQARARRPTVVALLAAAVVVFGSTSALVAQQRSGVLAYVVTLLTAVLLHARRHGRQLVWLLVGFGLVSILAADMARRVLLPATERFSDAGAFDDARDLRLGGFLMFLSDVVENPVNLVPIGGDSLFDRTGVVPHLLPSEAYYSGGPLFLIVILALLFKFGTASVRLAWSRDRDARMIGSCLCAFGTGALIEIMLQTSLGLRIVPLMIGVAIAGERVLRAGARPAVERTAWREAEAQ